MALAHEVLQGGRHDAGCRTPPPGVDDRNRGRCLEDHRYTIGGSYCHRETRRRCDDRISIALVPGRCCDDNRCAVDLIGECPIARNSEFVG
jgi:hypothetical protein